VASLVSALAIVLRIAGRVDPGRAVVACAVVCVLLTEVIQNNLRNAQINFVVLTCTLAFGWYWLRGRKWLASSLLAAAIAIKLTPGIFLLWLARRRDWRTLAASVAGAGALTVALPAIVTGPRIVDDLRGYLETFIGGVTPGLGTTSERRPFSVVGTLHRFTDMSWRFDAVVVGMGVLLVTGLLIDRDSRATGEQAAASMSLYLAAILLVTPLSEVHHLAFILPGLVWLTYRGLAGRLTPPRIGALAFMLAALVLRRSFHGAAFVAVAGTWFLLAAECNSLARSPRPISK
jgi:alpha-1,2-mannosyltransferase